MGWGVAWFLTSKCTFHSMEGGAFQFLRKAILELPCSVTFLYLRMMGRGLKQCPLPAQATHTHPAERERKLAEIHMCLRKCFLRANCCHFILTVYLRHILGVQPLMDFMLLIDKYLEGVRGVLRVHTHSLLGQTHKCLK